jgi:hypothetical protein
MVIVQLRLPKKARISKGPKINPAPVFLAQELTWISVLFGPEHRVERPRSPDQI